MYPSQPQPPPQMPMPMQGQQPIPSIHQHPQQPPPNQPPPNQPPPHPHQVPPPLRRGGMSSAVPIAPNDCPILVWMLALNREYSKEEYDQCYKVIKDCLPYVDAKAYDPQNSANLRHYLTHMLPLLMMRHRRIPRSKWRDLATPEGKHWIEQNTDDMNPEKALHSRIGYSLMWESSLCGMAMTQGRQDKVTFIGLGIKLRAIEGKLTLDEYIQSVSHKLTELEIRNITADPAKETILRRLSMVLACKAAYFNAVGSTAQDTRRLEFDIPNRRIVADGKPLVGWEFRIFEVRLGVARRESGTKKDILVVEEYQCACAFYRGWKDTSRFIFFKATKELEPWVQFINLDQMMKVLPKLSA